MKFKEYYLRESKISSIKDVKISIDIKNLDVHGTTHSTDRLNRSDNQGRDITENEIKIDMEKVLPKLFNDFANGEIPNNSSFIVFNKKSKLNIIAELKMQKGKDFIKVITVMRKASFKEKSGTYRYEI